MIAYQIVDAQGHYRFLTDRVPFEDRYNAQQLFDEYMNDEECQQSHPEWFPMRIVEVEWKHWSEI